VKPWVGVGRSQLLPRINMIQNYLFLK
jgi:hypothetical protein